MNETKSDIVVRMPNRFGSLVMRLGLAIVIWPHGAQKVLGWFGGPGFGNTLQTFTQKMHIPAPLAVLAILTEFLAPLFLVLGLFTRVAALGLGILITTAAIMVHVSNGFFMNWYGQKSGEGFEYHILVLAMALALLIQGGGKWALDWKLFHGTKPKAKADASTG